jgi:hypothetical protein
MDDKKKPAPLHQIPRPQICSICGKNSYSRAGVHPQCAAHAADRARMDKVKSMRSPALPSAPAAPTRYQKRCPRCSKLQHVRRKTCECGHVFSPAAPVGRPPRGGMPR